MEKIAVIYATKTKHSQKLAEAIGSALQVKTYNIKEKPNLDDAGLLFIVSGIYGGASMPDLLEFIENLEAPALKKVALVTSCASGKQRQDAVRGFFQDKGIEVVDEFVCKGALLFVSTSHPNPKDLKEAADFVLKIAEKDA